MIYPFNPKPPSNRWFFNLLMTLPHFIFFCKSHIFAFSHYNIRNFCPQSIHNLSNYKALLCGHIFIIYPINLDCIFLIQSTKALNYHPPKQVALCNLKSKSMRLVQIYLKAVVFFTVSIYLFCYRFTG